MRCQDWQERMLEREGLEQRERNELDQHLLACEGCRNWGQALKEVEAEAITQLRAEAGAPDMRLHILEVVALERRRRWVTAAPDLMDALGWCAVAILAMAILASRANGMDWIANHLLSAGAATMGVSLVWVVRVLWREGLQL